MKLQEVFSTSQNLEWEFNVNEFYSTFAIDDRQYGISAIEETVQSKKALRVDFHYKNNGTIQHNATNFGKDSFKVLSIIVNAIKQKFANDFDIIYFLAKKTENDKEFDSRVKLYSRIVDRLKVENNRISLKKEMQDEYLFALFKTEDDKQILLDFI
jgi:hypothetical protein